MVLLAAGGGASGLAGLGHVARDATTAGPWRARMRARGRATNNLASVPVQRADLLIKDLQLAGKLTLRTVREVKAPFGEAIANIDVAVGDTVQAGDELMTLDREQLAKDLDSAW